MTHHKDKVPCCRRQKRCELKSYCYRVIVAYNTYICRTRPANATLRLPPRRLLREPYNGGTMTIGMKNVLGLLSRKKMLTERQEALLEQAIAEALAPS